MLERKEMDWKKGILVMAALGCVGLSGCGHFGMGAGTVSEETESIESELIQVGFSQLGAESDWRNANTVSMKNSFTEENGYELLMNNAQQKHSNQITAIRTFIQQEVDYIILAPVIESEWETVLEEAKDAGIPVIIIDRQVDVEDDSLYTCWVGSDFKLEGQKATAWLHAFCEAGQIPAEEIHIADIQGTLGASAQIGRTEALEEAVQKFGWDLLAETPGDYTQTKAKEVMDGFLAEYENINVVYCENDNEAVGAIEAIEAAGRVPGSDIRNGEIMVISFDGVMPEAMEYCESGKISCIAECNPLHGPRADAIIRRLEKGEEPEKYWYVEEALYTTDNTVNSLEIDGVTYPVTVVTDEFLYDRAY